MAIYHFSAKVIGRDAGSSAVVSAAYRSASRLRDERLGRHHDFSNKTGVIHSEVMLPEGAPERLANRTTLWNEVEASEKREDAQLAREVEFAIPRELTREQGVALAREFVTREFVARSMVADLNVHWDIGNDGNAKPHAHVMLAMREIGPDGFGPKVRDWNATALLQNWRENWATHANARLQSLGIEARIDHRSYGGFGQHPLELPCADHPGLVHHQHIARGESVAVPCPTMFEAGDGARRAGWGAKVVMVGDVQQLQAIEAGAAFRVLAERHGAAEIIEVRRQTAQWMRNAARALATGRTGEALAAYARGGMVHRAKTRDAARAALIDRWDAGRRADPAASRLILTHMNREVELLNQAARARLAANGELGRDLPVQTARTAPQQGRDYDQDYGAER